MSGTQDSIDLTVVVPSVNGWSDLDGCLRALVPERSSVRLEVLVADRCGEPVRQRVRANYPWVKLIEAPAATTFPSLRAMAFAEARGKRDEEQELLHQNTIPVRTPAKTVT